MVGFLERFFGKNSDPDDLQGKSGKMAKDRLQFVLVQDRIKLPADTLQQMKQEILQVISKYVSVDIENVDFALSNRERNGLLVAEIPFIVAEEDDIDESDEMGVVSTSDEKILNADDDEESEDSEAGEVAEISDDFAEDEIVDVDDIDLIEDEPESADAEADTDDAGELESDEDEEADEETEDEKSD